MKNYEDFRIFYKDEEIINILSIVEECSYSYGEIEQVDYLIIKYINKNGKLVTDKFGIKDLTFKKYNNQLSEHIFAKLLSNLWKIRIKKITYYTFS